MYGDCVAIADHITNMARLEELCFVCYDEDECLVAIDDKGLEAITKALAGNQSLPLVRLKLEWKCTFTDTAADCLAHFISSTTTLQYLKMWWCTFSVRRLLKMVRAIHDNLALESSLKNLSCTLNGDDEVKDLAQLLVEYPQMENR